MLLTGGFNAIGGYRNTVSRYGTNGFVEDLAPLNEGRADHGCGVYTVASGDQVSITLYYTIVITNIVRYFWSPVD